MNSSDLEQKPPLSEKPARATNLTINIHVPKLRLSNIRKLLSRLKSPTIKRPSLPYKQLGIGLVGLAVISAVGMTGAHLLKPEARQAGSASLTKKTTAGSAVASTKPSFAPVVPSSKPELATPKQGVSSFDGKRDSYSYSDSFLGTGLTVSEQPMPANMGSTQGAVSKIAAKFGAKDQIKLDSNTAYLNTDAKSGNQIIVMAVHDVLIFVNSPFRHSVADWQNYLKSLQ